MQATKPLFCIIAALQLISCVSANCLYGTSLHERTLGKRAQVESFGYTNLLSPLNWANLNPDFIACSTSKNQSPINLDNSTMFATEVPQIDIPTAKTAQLLNLGTTLEVMHNGTTIFANQTFNFIQFHFHTPSEHRFNLEYFPVEMHMVHENAGALLLKQTYNR
jgi:carbonic anhydrase